MTVVGMCMTCAGRSCFTVVFRFPDGIPWCDGDPLGTVSESVMKQSKSPCEFGFFLSA